MINSLLTKYGLFGIILVFSSFFSYIFLKDYVMYIQWAIIAWMIIYVTVGKLEFLFSHPYLNKYVIYFIVVPWLSVIPAYFTHGQNIYQSAFALSTFSLVFLVYFVLLRFRITEIHVMRVLVISALIYTFIEIFQQYTYPTYWFAGREKGEESGNLEVRLGFYKFYMTGIHLVVLAVFYSWQKLLGRLTLNNAFIFFILTFGLYLFLARKMDFSFIFCIGISFFLQKRVKWYYWALFIVAFGLVFIYSENILGDFIEKSQAELGDKDFIRFQSLVFYLNYFNDIISLWLGNGREYGGSEYGLNIQSIQENFHFYRADIGVFAHLSYYGIIGFVPILMFLVFLFKTWSKLPLYIKLYFIFNSVMLLIAFPLNSIVGSFTFVIVLYLMELHLQGQKLKNNLLKEGYSLYFKSLGLETRPGKKD